MIKRREATYSDDMQTQIYYGTRGYIYTAVRTLISLPRLVNKAGRRHYMINDKGRQHVAKFLKGRT